MNAQFTKVWAIKSNTRHNAGETIAVSLKSGATKQIKLGPMIAEKERKDGSRYWLFMADGEEE